MRQNYHVPQSHNKALAFPPQLKIFIADDKEFYFFIYARLFRFRF